MLSTYWDRVLKAVALLAERSATRAVGWHLFARITSNTRDPAVAKLEAPVERVMPERFETLLDPEALLSDPKPRVPPQEGIRTDVRDARRAGSYGAISMASVEEKIMKISIVNMAATTLAITASCSAFAQSAPSAELLAAHAHANAMLRAASSPEEKRSIERCKSDGGISGEIANSRRMGEDPDSIRTLMRRYRLKAYGDDPGGEEAWGRMLDIILRPDFPRVSRSAVEVAFFNACLDGGRDYTFDRLVGPALR